MTLTAKELMQLRKLEEKAKDAPALTELDLARMEETIEQSFDMALDFLQSTNNVWNVYVKKLNALASDNAKLIGEVRRLAANNQVERQPQVVRSDA